MWLLKRRKTVAAVIEATIELLETADGHSLEEFVTCVDCGQLVLKDKAKTVEYRFVDPLCSGLGKPRHYCQTHAPEWDVVSLGFYGEQRCRRILAVPERLEVIVETPKARRPKKGR